MKFYYVTKEQLTKKCRYRNLTKAQKRTICNGCGPKGKGFKVPDFLFYASCDHHDFNYWVGYRIRDRLKADYQFYREMKKDVGRQVPWWNPKWMLYYKVVVVYFSAVRTFGAAFFHFNSKPRDWYDVEIAMRKKYGE